MTFSKALEKNDRTTQHRAKLNDLSFGYYNEERKANG